MMLSRDLLGSLDAKDVISTGPPSLASSNGQRAREYTAEEWEEQRERFTHYYQTPGLSLTQIQAIMKNQHAFDATQRQWKRKIKLWSLERNIKTAEGQWMVSLEAKRKHEGKKTKFWVNGREVSEAKFARIRRKLLKKIFYDPSIPTPANIKYSTPRDPPNQSQRRISIQASHHTHLVECFLCNTVTYGGEHGIMQAFRSHILSSHPGYDVLRCLDGFDAARQLPDAVRTTRQLPTNHCGYVHGVQAQADGGEETFVPVRLGRLCLVEGGTPKPYLSLTAAASCLTLRTEPRSDHHFETTNPMSQFSTQEIPFSMMEEPLDFGMNSFIGEFPDDPDNYLNTFYAPTADANSFFNNWSWDDDLGDQCQYDEVKAHWKDADMF